MNPLTLCAGSAVLLLAGALYLIIKLGQFVGQLGDALEDCQEEHWLHD